MSESDVRIIRDVLLSGKAVRVEPDPSHSSLLRRNAGGVIVTMNNGQQISFRVIAVHQAGNRTFVT